MDSSVTPAGKGKGLKLRRFFTTPGVNPYSTVQWETRDAVIAGPEGESFRQEGVEFPSFWSQNATNIVAQKYFRGPLGSPRRERSLRQLIDRVVGTLSSWGWNSGYFASEEDRDTFRDELTHILLYQMASFNSPVWFNVGVEPRPQASACFILAVEDTMASILNWYVEEGLIFKGGSGAGVNLSTIRSSKEKLSSGGFASGPVSFMRGADASAGTIKSGGKTRRAAKMVILNVDHPDIEEFIWCKAVEERKARVLAEAGFDMGLDGKDSHSIQYQNANNSVRVTDEFMHAVLEDLDWELKAVTTGEVVKRVRARELFRQIAEAAWESADPGLQFDTTINVWHTIPHAGRINASNPCSEYMSIDNSACNLASLNLMRFLTDDGEFQVEAFRHAVEMVFLAQEIIIDHAGYPTEKIERNARDFRQLGLGYSNLGALLMALGLPYDSDEGRALASAITAIMTGCAYACSARMAAALGPFRGFEANREPMLGVMRKHRDALAKLDRGLVPAYLYEAAERVWEEVLQLGEAYGFRNSQATLLAPTGTISFMMDCDTTGIEPDLALVKTKKLVGGGTMRIVNQTVPRALKALGYGPREVEEIVSYIYERNSVVGAPHLKPEHYPVFDCSLGERPIHYMGHIRMMEAVQPWLSGAISKTVNVPEDTTVEEIERIFMEAWRRGLKAIAIYRDNCKLGQPLQAASASGTRQKGEALAGSPVAAADSRQPLAGEGSSGGPGSAEGPHPPSPVRRRLPRKRSGRTISFRVADLEGYVTAGEYPEGGLGEIFIKVAKQGSTLSGVMDALAISVSLGLQYGVPLEAYVEKFVNMRFEPSGVTDDPDVRFATSVVDYIFRRLALEYLPRQKREALGILGTQERLGREEGEHRRGPSTGEDRGTSGPAGSSPRNLGSSEGRPVLAGGLRQPGSPAEEARGEALEGLASVATLAGQESQAGPGGYDAPYCYTCGVRMRPSGSCFVCEYCGTTSGCS